MTTIDFRTLYGVRETNGLTNPEQYLSEVDYDHEWTLKEVAAAGGKVTRIRLLGERLPLYGWLYDVSYVHATLRDGQKVVVSTAHLPEWARIPRRQLKGVLIEWAKAEGVFAKGLGLLDEGTWSTLG